MRIAFCGSSGTGKTTLATWLAEMLDIPLNPVGSRNVAKSMGFDNPYDVDKADLIVYQLAMTQYEWDDQEHACRGAAHLAMTEKPKGEKTCRGIFQERLLEEKVAWESSHDSFVTDRTTVDNFVYAALHAPYGLTEKYLRTAEEHLALYDVIFFTPCEAFHNLANDPSRVGELAYHHAFELFCDGALVNWLGDDWNEKVKHVTFSGLLRRQDQVMKALGRDLDGNLL